MYSVPDPFLTAELDYRRELARSYASPRKSPRRRHLVRHRQPSVPEQRKGSAVA